MQPNAECAGRASDHGRGLLCAELLPLGQPEHLLLGRTQPAERREHPFVGRSTVAVGSAASRDCSLNRRRSPRRWFATTLAATPNSHRRGASAGSSPQPAPGDQEDVRDDVRSGVRPDATNGVAQQVRVVGGEQRAELRLRALIHHHADTLRHVRDSVQRYTDRRNGGPLATVDPEKARADVGGGCTVSLPPLVEPAESLTVEEVRRYSRHLIIPDVAMTGQKRLKNAKVLCVGAGGLGSPALLYLAAAGVGTLGIIDFDVVDESNLQRQIIHGQSDIGRSKAESARDSVREINPLIQVNVHETRLDNDNVLDIFSQYDLILDGTDNFATRYLVNDACVLLNKPYVWGSIYRFDGQVSVFWNEYGPNYRDLYPDPPPPGMVPSCAEGGVLGVLCASIGSVMVNEAIKLITGIGEPLVGGCWSSTRSRCRGTRSRCARTRTRRPITELIDYESFCGVVSEEAQQAAAGSTITAAELKDLIDSDKPIYLVDVREPAEWEIVKIPGATLIPKDEILRGDALAGLPNDKQIVMYCKTGVRSAETLAAVKGAGFRDAVHVQGGVTAWVNQIDPSLPSY